MRKGLNPEETIAYSAEFKNTIPLRFVAVHNKEVSTAFMKSQDWNPIIFSLEPVLKAEAEIRLDDRIDDYLLLPIHPWQTMHTLQELYKTEIEQKKLLFLIMRRLM